MKAEEALKLSNNSYKDALEQILLNIKKCAESGLTRCYEYNSMSNKIKKELQDLGYDVNYDSSRSTFAIKWEQ